MWVKDVYSIRHQPVSVLRRPGLTVPTIIHCITIMPSVGTQSTMRRRWTARSEVMFSFPWFGTILCCSVSMKFRWRRYIKYRTGLLIVEARSCRSFIWSMLTVFTDARNASTIRQWSLGISAVMPGPCCRFTMPSKVRMVISIALIVCHTCCSVRISSKKSNSSTNYHKHCFTFAHSRNHQVPI